MTIASRLSLALERSGKKQADVARLSGLTPQAVSFILSGKTASLRGNTAVVIAQALGVRTEWLVEGTPPMESREDAQGVTIPLLQVQASAGEGIERSDEVAVAQLVLDQAFIERYFNNIPRKNLRCIHAYGDSMLPTIEPGDILLVDTSVNVPDVDGVYVMSANNSLFVKRVSRRMDGKYEISSDNPVVKTVFLLDKDLQVECLGRVLSTTRTTKL